MYAIAHGGCTDTVRESAPNVDWENYPLLYRGIEPVPAAAHKTTLSGDESKKRRARADTYTDSHVVSAIAVH